MPLDTHTGNFLSVTTPTESLLEEDEASRVELLKRDIDEIQRQEQDYEYILRNGHSVWESKKEMLTAQIRDVRRIKELRKEELDQLEKGIPQNAPRCLICVQGSVFTTISVMVVLANFATMCMQRYYADIIDDYELYVYWLNQAYLAFYIVELILKCMLYDCGLFCRPCCAAILNWIDLVVVLTGIADQWALPFCVDQASVLDESNIESFAPYLKYVRLLRIVRILQYIFSFLQSDLSWADDTRFQGFMMCVIGFNSITFALQADLPDLVQWSYVNGIFLAVYTFELIVRLRHWRCRFFCHKVDWAWNWLDFAIVVGLMMDLWLAPVLQFWHHVSGQPPSGLDSSMPLVKPYMERLILMLRIARLLRFLRLVHLMKSIPPLHALMLGLRQSLQGMVWVFLMTLALLYLAAVLCVTLIGHGLAFGSNPPMSVAKIFPTVLDSMYVLFQVMQGDTSDLLPLFEAVPISKAIFAAFMVISSWALMALLVAVVSASVTGTSERTRQEAERESTMKKAFLNNRRLEELLIGVDLQTSHISGAEFQRMLADERMKTELSDLSGLQQAELVRLFEILASYQVVESGEIACVLHRRELMDGLMSDGHSVTQRAMVRLEKRLVSMEQATMRIETKAEEDRNKFGMFMESVEEKLASVKELSALAPVLARVEQRLNADAEAQATVVATVAKATNIEQLMERLEGRLGTDVAAVEEAAAKVAKAADRLADLQTFADPLKDFPPEKPAEDIDMAFASKATEALGDGVEACTDTLDEACRLQEVKLMAAEDPKAMEDFGLKELSAGGMEVEINKEAELFAKWNPDSLASLKEEDVPLPVPQPRFSPQAHVATRAEDMQGSLLDHDTLAEVFAVGSVGDAGGGETNKEDEGHHHPVDPMDHLLN